MPFSDCEVIGEVERIMNVLIENLASRRSIFRLFRQIFAYINVKFSLFFDDWL